MLSPEALAELVDLVAAEVERRRNGVTSAVATPGLLDDGRGGGGVHAMQAETDP